MSKLPRNIRYEEVANLLRKLGYTASSNHSGTHLLFVNREGRMVTLVRRSPVKHGTLQDILDKVGITREEFLKLL